jgi:hypothetical protein
MRTMRFLVTFTSVVTLLLLLKPLVKYPIVAPFLGRRSLKYQPYSPICLPTVAQCLSRIFSTNYVLNFTWSDYVANSILHRGLVERVSIRLLEKQLSFAGHCMRSIPPISELLLRDHTKVVKCTCARGPFSANYSRQVLKAIETVVTSDEEVEKLMLNREA